MVKVRWGILSTARTGVKKVIPEVQKGRFTEVVAIASRNGERANEAADTLNIEKRYDSYEALLEDPDVDAIYNPLPNHLHVEWTIRAMEPGKHLLCEKPIGLDPGEVLKLVGQLVNSLT